MGGLFRAMDRFPGASPAVRRSLSSANLDTLAVRRVEGAAKALKMKPTIPVWRGSVWAHVGFEKERVAVVFRVRTCVAEEERFRALWREQGWTALTVDQEQIELMSEEDILRELREALKEIGRAK